MLTSPISFLSKNIPSSRLACGPNAASRHSNLQLSYVRFTLHLSRCNTEWDLVRESYPPSRIQNCMCPLSLNSQPVRAPMAARRERSHPPPSPCCSSCCPAQHWKTKGRGRIWDKDGKPGMAPGRNHFSTKHERANKAAFQLPSFRFSQLSHGFHFKC